MAVHLPLASDSMYNHRSLDSDEAFRLEICLGIVHGEYSVGENGEMKLAIHLSLDDAVDRSGRNLALGLFLPSLERCIRSLAHEYIADSNHHRAPQALVHKPPAGDGRRCAIARVRRFVRRSPFAHRPWG